MNKTAIKNFSIWARNKLIDDIRYHAGLLGITEDGIKNALPQSAEDTEFYDIGTAEPYSVSGKAVRQRRKLVEVIHRKEQDSDYKTAYKYILEEVAYTWFNRLIAIRFMEVNDYLPSHIRVLSSDSGKLEPDMVTTPFDTGLVFTASEEQMVVQMKQDNQIDELFRLLFIKQCNALNEILPGLFEKTNDYTELLFSVSIIDQDSVVYHLIHDIDEDDFNIEKGGQVEIIGWLYQYWNTEPKDAVFGRPSGTKIQKEEIPAATQLFTPDWIVRYMVENSLGRLWVEGHPNDDLKANWKYYLEEAEQEADVQVQLAEIRKEYANLSPEDIKCIDPCMGSGHILCYLFDVFMQIYESQGYSRRDAAQSILKYNLYGLDIDERAYQLAYFAVMMKARQYDRRIFFRRIHPNVYAIQESNNIKREQLKYFGANLGETEKKTVQTQIEGLLDTLIDAKEYGSILNVNEYDWNLMRKFVNSTDIDSQISLNTYKLDETVNKLKELIEIGKLLAQKYEVVVTNPPYAGTSNLSAKMNNFVKKHYPDSKADLFAVFIERCGEMLKRNGLQAMITQHTWMFIRSFEALRKKLIKKHMINMTHLGIKAFEEIGNDIVQTCTFVFCNNVIKDYISKFVRLVDYKSYVQKETAYFDTNNVIVGKCDYFEEIPGVPYAYYVSLRFIKNFFKAKYIEDYGKLTGSQNITGNNEKYLRMAWEVNSEQIGNRWRFYAKGGDYRQYYGNLLYIVDWSENARKFYSSNKTSNLLAREYWYKEGITYSAITSRGTGFRYLPKGCIFDKGGPSVNLKNNMLEILALLNSNVAKYYFWVFNPSINLQIKDIKNFPIILSQDDKVEKMANDNLICCKEDWDSFECSWNFKKHPLCEGVTMGKLEDKFKKWEEDCNVRFNILKANEEKLNKIFIDIYGLQDELIPEIEERDVTVRKAEVQRDIRSLISYTIGCMFGRYSLAKEGLMFAGGQMTDVYQYHSGVMDGGSMMDTKFPLDGKSYYYLKGDNYLIEGDNIIPITDEEYFQNDIVNRFVEFVKIVYGADTLEENLDFIAKALGNKGTTSREVIRNYFLKDFFPNHCKTYQKRPIYWLFDSGKQNGLKALIYLHRYTKNTIGNLRIDYLHHMQRIYESEINRMQDMIDYSNNPRETATATKRKEKLQKQLKECREYDEKISHLALSRIELDLDDGVKVNYRKIQTATDGKFYEVLADSKNIIGKK